MGIVKVALVIVGENLVGLLCGFEADLCFLAFLDGDLIGVVCERSLGLFVRMVGQGFGLDAPTLWYAFLISTLLALLLMPRTSVQRQYYTLAET